MSENRTLDKVKCPDCENQLRCHVDYELDSSIKVWIECPKCGRKWHVLYTCTGSMD